MKIRAVFAISIAFVLPAFAQGPGGGGFTPGGGNQPGGGGGSFSYDSLAVDATNSGVVYRTDGGFLYRLASAPSAFTAPAAVTAVADGLFAGCTTLKTADFSATSIAELPADCFAGCTALTSVILPKTCTAIGPNAFAGCTALSSVTAPGVASVGADTFRGCASLAALPAFAEGATLGAFSFADSGLAAADLDGLAPGPGVFAGCTFLSTLENTPSVLPDALCAGCTALDFDPSDCTALGQAALAGVPYDTIYLSATTKLSDYAFAADAAIMDTLLETADPTVFDPADRAFLGRTLSYDTGDGVARVEAASLVDWLVAEGEAVTQPASYATADLETWLDDADNLYAYTGADLTVYGDAFLYTPPSATATSVFVTLEGATDLLADDPWSADTLSLASTSADGVETYVLADVPEAETAEEDGESAEATTPTCAFARLVFTRAW